MNDLGSLIREERLRWGLTQTDVATAAGLTTAAICQIEMGRRPIVRASAQAILSALRLELVLLPSAGNPRSAVECALPDDLELVLLPGAGNPRSPVKFPLPNGWHRLRAPAWICTYRGMVVAWVHLEPDGAGAHRWRWGTFASDDLRYAATAASAIEAADLYLAARSTT